PDRRGQLRAPWRIASLHHVLEDLPVSQRVHRSPEPLIFVGHKVPAFDQAVEWLEHKLFTILDKIENLPAEDEEAAIDPDFRFLARADPLHGTVRVEFREVEADRGMDGDEAADLSAFLELTNHVRQRRIGEAVAVVGEKHLLVLDEVLDRQQSLSNVSPRAGIDERDAPFRRLFAEDLDLLAEARDDAVAVRGLPIVKKVFLDDVGFVSEAQDEVLVPILAVVLHHVPQDRLMSDRHHGLRNAFRIFANSGPEPTAEQDDLHDTSSRG